MYLEIVTKQDLSNLKNEILLELRAIVKSAPIEKEWLKSSDVRRILNCSPGTLQNLRVNGKLPFSKVGGTMYYKLSDVKTLLDDSNR